MENNDIVRQTYELFAEGKTAEAAQYYAPNAVWLFPWRNALSGEYTGRDAIVNDLVPKLASLSRMSYRAALTDIADGGEHTFALQRSQAKRDGKSIDYVVCNVFSVKDGLIQKVETFPFDAAAQDEFWQ